MVIRQRRNTGLFFFLVVCDRTMMCVETHYSSNTMTFPLVDRKDWNLLVDQCFIFIARGRTRSLFQLKISGELVVTVEGQGSETVS